MNESNRAAYTEHLVGCLARLRDERKEVHILQVSSTRLSAGLEASGIQVNRIVPGSNNSKNGEKKYRATFVSRPRRTKPELEPKASADIKEEDDEYALTDELLESYKKAYYVVFAELHIAMRIGVRSQHVQEVMQREGVSTAAFITAYNPRSRQFARYWNRELLMFLRHDVEINGYDHLGGEGCDPDGNWEPEESLLVLGISREEADRFARKYDQHAFVFIGADGVPELAITKTYDEANLPAERSTKRGDWA